MIHVKKFTEIMISYDVSPEEFYIIDALYKKEFTSLKNYIKNQGNFDVKVLKNLEKKGYIEYWGKDDKYNVFDILVTDKFFNSIYIDSEVAGNEFFKTYPSFIKIDGRDIMSKKCDKDLYTEKYCKDIGFDKERHFRIIEGLKIAKKKGLINMAIRNFIDSQMYDTLEEIYDTYKDSNNESSTFRESI